MEAVNISETSVNFYETARCNIPEDSRLGVGVYKFHGLCIDGRKSVAGVKRLSYRYLAHKYHIPLDITLTERCGPASYSVVPGSNIGPEILMTFFVCFFQSLQTCRDSTLN
jgi:hypothetical protein